MLTNWELGPRGTASIGDGALALSCVAALAGGTAPDRGWISSPEVAGLVADAVELAAVGGAGHPWQRGIMALDPAKCPASRNCCGTGAEGAG